MSAPSSLRRPALFLGLALLVWACGGEEAEPDLPEPTLTSIQARVFRPVCAAVCHRPGGIGFGETGLDLSSVETSLVSLVGHPATEAPSLNRVEAGDPEASYLIHKLEGRAMPEGGRCCDTQMPLDGTPLSGAVIGRIREWIAAGAPR